jgi:RND family efflux transporter MFP subunit
VIVTALVVAGLAWQRARAPAAPTAPAAPVASAPASVEFAPGDLAVMQPGRMVRSVPLTGTLRPVNQTVVRTKVAGDLREAPVREGMPVKRGQTVARIDPTEYEVRVRERDAQRLAAEAQLEQAKRTLDNTRQLHERGFVSQSALDQVLSAREVAAGNRDAAIAQLALARKALADTVLTAPIDGVVAERFAQPGEKLPVDGRVLSIVDLSRMEIEAPVPAAEVGGVLIGQAVELRIEGVAQRQTGRVVRIAPTTQPGTRSVPVYIALDNRDPSVRAGLFAQGSLAVESRDGVLALPAAAVRDAGARLFVYAIDDGRLVERDIRLGMRDDASGTVEVREGLRTGERVVVANLGALRAGSLVKVAEPGAAAAPAPAR